MDYEQMMLEQSAANSAWNAEQAQINRDWNEYMSGTSHQREVKDLIAAGINPVLSANSGASWQSVANPASDSNSASGAAALALAARQLDAQERMNLVSAQATKAAAATAAGGAITAANISAAASRDVALTNQQTAKDTAPVSTSGGALGVSGSSSMPAYIYNDIINSAQAIGNNSLAATRGKSGIGNYN